MRCCSLCSGCWLLCTLAVLRRVGGDIVGNRGDSENVSKLGEEM